MSWVQVLILAVVQGLAELLPVSSSAHVIVAEKLMGLDPSTPQMTFLLVMLHTGTMFAVLLYFGKRWAKILRDRGASFLLQLTVATIATGAVGLGIKVALERFVLPHFLGAGEIHDLFKVIPVIAVALATAGALILVAAKKERKTQAAMLDFRSSAWIGLVQGICLPFRGFSRSGATISTAMLRGVSRSLAEEFSFALAVILTPPVIANELYRLVKSTQASGPSWHELAAPGLIGMVLSFGAGLVALKWLSNWLEKGRWAFFGIYCLVFAAAIGVAWGFFGL